MAFSLTSEARAALETRITQSAVAEPVIAFVRVAADFQSDRELKRLLASQSSDESVIREKFLKLNPAPQDLNWRWAPAVYPSSAVPDAFRYETDGITFILPPPLRERVANACLDVSEGGFVFRSGGNCIDPF